MTRKRAAKAADDPLLRACTACGARIGEGCKTVGKNDNRRTYASRLVHAVRLEEGATDA